MTLDEIKAIAINGLEDVKAENIVTLPIDDVSDYADLIIVASGQTQRQVKALADRVVEYAKEAGMPPIGVEGQESGEWVLVDLGQVIVHILLPWARDHYALEKLWSTDAKPSNTPTSTTE